MTLKIYDKFFDLDEPESFEGFDVSISNAINSVPLDSQMSIVDGVIRSADKKKGIICVDVGLKSEGFMSMDEFFLVGEKESIDVGEKVEVFLGRVDKKDSGIALSRAMAIRKKSWDKLAEAKETGDVVEGVAFSRVKGGVSVDFQGVIAFLPGSQIDVRPVRDISNVVGKKVAYKVLSIEEKSRSVIVSRKAILELEKKGDREKFLEGVEEGVVLTGVVKNVTNYGAFVDLGAVDGLLHVTDIVWEKISHPSEILSVGQEIKVKVIKYDVEGKRLSLGMKQLTENPWSEIYGKYKAGTVVKGKIVNVTTYGVFVQLEPGVEGLLHISEISWAKDSHKKHKEMEVGQEFDVMVIEIDVSRHRIALSLKQLTENPWERFVKSYNVGEILDGVVRNVTDFGVFVGIDGFEIDGLIHTSDISWDSESPPDMSIYKKGDVIKVAYLGSEPENQRIRLSVKQLTADPLLAFKEDVSVGAIVTCRVTEIKPDGIGVEIFDSVKAFIKKANLARERVEQRADKFVIGDRVDAKVVKYDKDNRRFVLSIRAFEEDEHSKSLEKYGSVDVGATIGDILGEAIGTANESLEAKKEEKVSTESSNEVSSESSNEPSVEPEKSDDSNEEKKDKSE